MHYHMDCASSLVRLASAWSASSEGSERILFLVGVAGVAGLALDDFGAGVLLESSECFWR